MPKESFKVYPSGFLGSNTVANTKPMDLERIKDRLFDLSAITNPDGHTGNLEITRIWNSVTNGDRDFNSFDTHEAILRNSVAAFGSTYLYDWIKIQRQSPYFNDYHVKWIDETLMYIVYGKTRQLSAYNWCTMLKATAGGGSFNDTPIIRHTLFGEGLPSLYNESISKVTNTLPKNVTILEFIERWVQIPGGIDDLIASLYVLFGER
jgi:hypothetical protein